MAADAVQGYVESLVDRNLPIPEDKFAITFPVTAKVA